MPDRPFADPRDGKPIMAKPNLNMVGRTAGSPDNAQGTHFFLINDTGTYFLRKLPPPADGSAAVFDEATLLARAAEAKVQAARPPHRRAGREPRLPGVPRLQPVPVEPAGDDDPVPGSRSLAAVHQRDDVPADAARGRPADVVDDRNFYRPAGVKKWVQSGFLNKDIKVPLGAIWAMRTQIEADLLLQNLMLTADAMGLGAWIHASLAPPVLLGDPKFRKHYGPMLGFDWSIAPLEADRHPALARAAAEVRQRAGDLRRAPAQGRAPDQGDVPAQLRQHGRGRRRRRGRQVRPEGHLLRRGTLRAHLPRRVRRAVPQGGQQLLGRRDRLCARHLHLHLRNAWAIPRALRHDPRARGLAADPSRGEARTTRSTSATG